MVKDILTHNLPYKILALVLAFVLWMVILNAEDPVITREFSNITVTEINADVITEAGKAYSYVDGQDTVNVRVSGRTSVANRVTRDDITATVDLSKISETTGAVPVDVSCDKYPSLDVTTEGSSGILRIEIEDLEEKALNVQVETNGNAPDGKYIGKGVATPNLVTVSGPKSVVDNVAGAKVSVAVSDQSTSDITTNSEVRLVDDSGNEVNSSLLTLSQSDISVTVPIYNTKNVPLELNITGTPGSGYSVISSEYEPKVVTIAGPDDKLAKVESLELKDYDISDSTGNIEESFVVADNLKESLPDGVSLTDPSVTVAVAIDIEKAGEETYNMPVDQIRLSGTSSALKYTLSGDTDADTISVVLSGTSSTLKNISASDLSGTVDVSGLSAGEYDLNVDIDPGDGLELAQQPSVHVTVSEGESETQ